MRAVEGARADPAPGWPVYHDTVLAGVPDTSVVAAPSGVVPTRFGGSPKKSLPAATAEAATSDVFASVPIEAVSAALRLADVAAGVAPIAKLPAGVGVAFDAVSLIDSVVPSGRLNVKLIASPLLGLEARPTETAGGDPAGPLTVAPVSDEETE